MEDNKKLEQGFDDPTRQVMKREVEHFTVAPEQHSLSEVKVSKNDNAYGVTWANLVKEYLTTAYLEDTPQAEVEAWGVTYKVLRREKTTVFYDVDGNTLFDVENERLKKEYEWITKSPASSEENTEDEVSESEHTTTDEPDEMIPMGTASLKDIVTGNVPAPTKEEVEAAEKENAKPVREKAADKLRKELEAAKDKSFADPVINHLLKRVEESEALATDICQEHKTWEKCFSYIYEQARKQATGNSCAVRDDVVYEWAEDYYHKDDKAEEEKRAKEAEKKKAKAAGAKATSKDAEKKPVKSEPAKPVKEKAQEVQKPKPQPKKNNKDMDGQMDLFSLMGM